MGNQTHNLLVYGMMLQPTEQPSLGSTFLSERSLALAGLCFPAETAPDRQGLGPASWGATSSPKGGPLWLETKDQKTFLVVAIVCCPAAFLPRSQLLPHSHLRPWSCSAQICLLRESGRNIWTLSVPSFAALKQWNVEKITLSFWASVYSSAEHGYG